MIENKELEQLKYRNNNWLYQQYIEKEKTLNKIAEKCNVSRNTITKWMIIICMGI